MMRMTAKMPNFASARRNISFGVVQDTDHISLKQENLTLKNELDLLRMQREEEVAKENALLVEEVKQLRAKDEERKEKLRQIKENYRLAMEGVLKVTQSI